MMTRVEPCELCERISLTPAMVPRARSSGVATDDAIVSGLAPGREADTVIAGAPFEDGSGTSATSMADESAANAGAATVFLRQGTAWTPQRLLKPAGSGTAQFDLFGYSVAISGDTVVVGAPWEDSDSTGVNSTPDESSFDAGAAYVFVRSGMQWTQQAYLKPAAVGSTQASDWFGFAVAVAGMTVFAPAAVKPPAMPWTSSVGRDQTRSSTMRSGSPVLT